MPSWASQTGRASVADNEIGLQDSSPVATPPALSIVMPAYRAERYIGQAIESILAQTFEDFELIVYADGRLDRTTEIAESYASADGRVRVMGSDTNAGVCPALNNAIAEARGSLIGRMDADDLAVPDRFERLVSLIRSDPRIVAVGSNALHINIDNEVLGLSIAGPASLEDFDQMRANGEVTMLLDGTALMRRDVFEQVGGYDAEMAAAPEVDLFCRMAAYGAIVSIQEPLLLYRLHPGSSVERQFYAGRSVHRYVGARERGISRGESVPTFGEFQAAEQSAPVWHRIWIRRDDMGQFYYRAAGVLLSEGRRAAAIASLVKSFALGPSFVVGRVWNRRISPSARTRMKGTPS